MPKVRPTSQFHTKQGSETRNMLAGMRAGRDSERTLSISSRISVRVKMAFQRRCVSSVRWLHFKSLLFRLGIGKPGMKIWYFRSPPCFQKVFVFFSVERFVFCRKLPYQKQPSPSIITIKGDVFYYHMGQYLEGTRCDLRLIV